MKRIALLLGAFVLPACTAWAFSGCGGDTLDGGDGLDATADGHVTVIVPNDDAPSPKADGGSSEAGHVTSAVGNCSPVDSPACDVVLNNCPASEAGVAGECLPGQGDASATCTFERPSQHLPAGHTCCPTSSYADDPCLSGSECQGDPCIDGGPISGRCSPRCCDDTACGESPEGIAGHCTLTIVNDEGDTLYEVCTYQRPCKPFHVQVCPTGEVCTIQDRLGTSTCADLFLPTGGDGSEGTTCAASNSCAEGLTCLATGDDDDDDDDAGDASAEGGDAGDAGGDDNDLGQCFYECIVSGTSPPFDAGPNAAPGYGGCPQGEVCNLLGTDQNPSWLGYCAAP